MEELKKEPDVDALLKEYGKLMAEHEIDEEGVTIRPDPCFVIKTKDEAGQKVFLNMTTSDHIEAPHTKSLPDTEDQGLRIPLSLGPPREDFDKAGNPARIFDVVLNPATAEDAKNDKVFRQFLVELAVNYVDQKYQQKLSLKFKMPKMKYKGRSIPLQRVKAKKEPRIEEVGSSSATSPAVSHMAPLSSAERQSRSASAPTIAAAPAANIPSQVTDKRSLEPIFSVSMRRRDDGELDPFVGISDPALYESVFVMIDIPMLNSTRGAVLEVSEELMSFDVPRLYHLNLFMPAPIDDSAVTAAFDKFRRKLVVTLPLVCPSRIVVEEVPAAEEKQAEALRPSTASAQRKKVPIDPLTQAQQVGKNIPLANDLIYELM